MASKILELASKTLELQAKLAYSKMTVLRPSGIRQPVLRIRQRKLETRQPVLKIEQRKLVIMTTCF
jgi:hypothetical protein